MLPGQKNRCLFAFPHIAFRGMFYELAALAGQTDFSSNESVQKLLDKTLEVHDIYTEHNHLETDAIIPLVREIDEEIANKWEAEHAAAPHNDSKIQGAIKAVLAETDIEKKQHLGLDVYRDITLDIAHHLEHMLFEERTIMPVFRRKYDDAGLDQVEVSIVSKIPPAHMQRLTPMFLKYHSPAGKAFMLSLVKNTAPEPAFAGVCGLARSLMSPEEVTAVEKYLGFPLA